MSEATTSLPQIHLLLQPKSADGVITGALEITLSIGSPNLKATDILATLETESCLTPCQSYTPSISAEPTASKSNSPTISAHDALGFIPLTKRISGSDQQFLVNRATSGDIVIKCLAYPRIVDNKTRSGARIDLRTEEDGMQGSGSSMIPLPPWMTAVDKETGSAPKHRIGVEWDLSNCPEGTRTVWTWGEGPELIEVQGQVETFLSNVQYMVGEIISYPSHDMARNKEEKFGFYYFSSSTSAKIKNLGPVNESLFSHMSNMFEGDIAPEERDPYRIFVRKSALPHAFGGSAFARSYVLEYGDKLQKTENEFLFILSHEMVHNWPSMAPEEGGEENHWFTEGIANYYGTLLPYRFGIISEEEYIAEVNSMLNEYYTNPLREVPQADLDTDRWSDILKVEVPYVRGFTFFLKIDSLIRTATNGAANLDNVVLDLVKKQRTEWIRRREWIDGVEAYLGAEVAEQTLKDMLRGELVILLNDVGPGREVVQKDQEGFEIGFELDDDSIVTAITLGSRAAEAGVEIGDEVLSQSAGFHEMCKSASNMELKVRRKGREVEKIFSYWPRTKAKISCWEIRLVQ